MTMIAANQRDCEIKEIDFRVLANELGKHIADLLMVIRAAISTLCGCFEVTGDVIFTSYPMGYWHIGFGIFSAQK